MALAEHSYQNDTKPAGLEEISCRSELVSCGSHTFNMVSSSKYPSTESTADSSSPFGRRTTLTARTAWLNDAMRSGLRLVRTDGEDRDYQTDDRNQ